MFLVCIAPLWYLLIVSFYKRPSYGWKSVLRPWFGGVFLGILSLSITLSFLTRTPFGMNLKELYLWAWIRETGWPLTIGGLYITFRHIRSPIATSQMREFAGFLSGMASVYLLWHAFIRDPGFDFYRVLFTPFLWLGVLPSTIFVLDHGMRLSTFHRYLVLLLALIIPSAFIILPILYFHNVKILSWTMVLLCSILMNIVLFCDSRKWFT